MAGGWGGTREGSGRKPEGYEPPPEKVDYDRERAEHERVKRKQREFKLAQERGEYLPRDAVRQASATVMAVMAQALRSLPDNLERQFALPPEVVEAISEQCDAALADLSVGLRKMAAPPAEGQQHA